MFSKLLNRYRQAIFFDSTKNEILAESICIKSNHASGPKKYLIEHARAQ
jgi:hypothetical protein